MTRTARASVLVLFLFIASVLKADAPAAGKQVPVSTPVKGKDDTGEREVTLRHLLYLPADYDTAKDTQWPLVLFLHGSGERGDNIERVKIHGPPKLVASGKQFPFILCSPQCPANSRWNADELNQLVESLAGEYRIDRQRLYVTGLSMGGAGTWSLIASQPEKFAAAMPLCGRGDLEAIDKLAKTPTWVLVGGKDRPDTVQNCQDMANALTKAGGKGRLTLYFELPHDCWTITYNNPETYDWLLAQRRESHP
jgi:predicted peptidase